VQQTYVPKVTIQNNISSIISARELKPQPVAVNNN